MCTPVGHSLAGAILVRNSRFPFSFRNGKSVLGLLVVANLPDIDFLFGWIAGNPNQYHQGATHSLLFIVAVSVLAGWGYSRFHPTGTFQTISIIFGVLLLHLVCDMLGKDSRTPVGIPLFWPISDISLHSPVSIFGSVYKSSGSSQFIRSLFCWHNMRTVLGELGVMGVVYAGLKIIGKRR